MVKASCNTVDYLVFILWGLFLLFLGEDRNYCTKIRPNINILETYCCVLGRPIPQSQRYLYGDELPCHLSSPTLAKNGEQPHAAYRTEWEYVTPSL